MSAIPAASRAFDKALSDFKDGLTEKEKKDFAYTSIKDVYREAEAIQKEQSQRASLRNMNRIQPYINGLLQFSGVIEVFIQAKPEIMAFIWGPTKFLLQIASTHTDTFDKLVKALEKIGENLPRLEMFAELFQSNLRMHEVLVMVYEDILTFHRSTLKFFRARAWKQVFKSLWCTFEDQFGGILSNLERHRVLLDNEATAAHIVASHEARVEALRVERERQKDRDRQRVRYLKEWLDPVDYEAYLARLGRPCSTTGTWFIQEKDVNVWLDINDTTKRMLWLTGIPGSGKTILSSSLLQHVKWLLRTKGSVIFAFLRDENSTFATMMRTFIFQLLLQNSHLLPYLNDMCESKPYSPLTLPEELENVLEIMLGNIGVTYLIIDGLDEIELEERKMVLSALLSLLSKSDNLKIFLSSRSETDISDALKPVINDIYRVDIGDNNRTDIASYVLEAGKEVLDRFGVDDAARKETQIILDQVALGAGGMFLWARLVIFNLLQQFDLEGLQDAARNLPTGLDAAYGRILQRINERLSPNERDLARRVLEWVLCCTRPLRLKELEQALATRVGERSTNKRRRLLRRLDELCGPILEIDVGEKVHFVHFTAKEYLTSAYSGPFTHLPLAHRNVANICIAYLSFSCFDNDLSDGQILEGIRSGEYCLHEYAEQNWLFHTKQANKMNDSTLDDLTDLLERFFELQRDPGTPHTFLRVPSEEQFPIVADHRPQVHAHLIDCEVYYSGKLDQKNIERKSPLKLQRTIQTIREHLENFLVSLPNSDVQLQLLHQIYGTNLFKCLQFNCLHYVEGFETKKKRDEHLKTHFRPFKCSARTCDFASMGFASTEALNRHLRLYHPNLDTHTGDFNLAKTDPSESLGEGTDLTVMLFDAILTGDLASVESVVTQDLDINATNSSGDTALHCALEVHSEEIVQHLLENGADPNNKNRKKGDTSLHSAAAQGSEAFVELLLAWGADVSLRNSNKDTALDIAIAKKADGVVHILLDNSTNAELGSVNKHQQTAMDYALTQDSETIFLIFLRKVLIGGKKLVDRKKSRNKGKLIDGREFMSETVTGANALGAAIRKGWNTTVRLLLQSGVPIDSKGATGAALVVAAEKGNEPMVRLLLARGASVDISTGKGRTALITAAGAGHEPLVRLLLEQGADTNKLILDVRTNDDYRANSKQLIPKGFSQTALAAAAKSGHEAIVQLLLDHGADVNLSRSKGYSSTALIAAATNGHEGTVQLLLEHGADVDKVATMSGTFTALEAAAGGGHEATVQLLLKHGADVNKQTTMRTSPTALVAAAGGGHEAIVRLLLKHGADVSNPAPGKLIPLTAAIENRRKAVAQLLLEKGAEIDHKGEEGGTALIVAATNGWVEGVQMLLENGANIDLKTTAGDQALVTAGSAEVAKLLLEKGAEIDSRGNNGRTPLIAAAERGSMEVVRVLLENGADVEARDDNGDPVLIYAAQRYWRSDIAELLLEKGVNVNQRGSKGQTALMLAAEKGGKDLVQVLLKRGADVSLKDDNGATALTNASVLGFHCSMQII